MNINDGGNFSDDPVARLLAMKLGSMSESDLQKQEQIPQDAINLASGTIGSIKNIRPNLQLAPELAEKLEMGLAERIRQAAANSKVKGPEGGLTNNASMYQQGSPFQEAAKARFQELKEAIKKSREK